MVNNVCCVLSHSIVSVSFATHWIVAHQSFLSMGFSRQDWGGLSFPSPGDLPNPEIKFTSLVSLHCRWILYLLSHNNNSILNIYCLSSSTGFRAFILSPSGKKDSFNSWKGNYVFQNILWRVIVCSWSQELQLIFQE